MARYFVLGNVPFSEIEREEFIDVLTYGRPLLRARIIGADQMKVKVNGLVNDAEEWLSKHIAVSAAVS